MPELHYTRLVPGTTYYRVGESYGGSDSYWTTEQEALDRYDQKIVADPKSREHASVEKITLLRERNSISIYDADYQDD